MKGLCSQSPVFANGDHSGSCQKYVPFTAIFVGQQGASFFESGRFPVPSLEVKNGKESAECHEKGGKAGQAG